MDLRNPLFRAIALAGLSSLSVPRIYNVPDRKPRRLTEHDHACLAAAQRKRERKAAKARYHWKVQRVKNYAPHEKYIALLGLPPELTGFSK